MSEARPLTTLRRSSKETMVEFPLGQWFDLSKPISRYGREACEAQMAFNAHKQGADPAGPDGRRAIEELRGAVERHNAALRLNLPKPEAPPIA
jgi:hypothetical protein